MSTAPNAIALLIFRVGPVLCCAPADPVQTIMAPPKLTHPPGTSPAKPGIFYHTDHVVSVSDLRHRFGVPEAERDPSGRLIVALHDGGHTGYWVDEIIEVIDTPKEGWADPPSRIPTGIFTKTLLLKEQIYLFAELARFSELPETNYLSRYIDRLAGQVSDEGEDTPPPATVSPSEHTAEEARAPLAAVQEPDIEATSPKEQDEPLPTATAIEEGPVTAPITTPPDRENEQPVDSALTPIDTPATEADTPPITPGSLSPSGQTAALAIDEQTIPVPDNGETAPSPASAGPDTPQAEAEAAPQNNVTPVAEAHVPQDEAANEPATAQEAAEQGPTIPTAAEKAARYKNILKPAPHTPPPVEPAQGQGHFQWQNILAALLLFLTIAGIGVYQLLSNPGPSNPGASKPEQARTDRPAKDDQGDTTPTAPEQRKATDKVQKSTPAKAVEEPSPDAQDYHAEIKPDSQGVTIVLHSPEDEPVLKEEADVPTSPSPPTAAKKSRPKVGGTVKTEIVHTVVKGDTLWAIAEHYVSNPYRYPELARLSKIEDPDRIYPGDRVRIVRQPRKRK